MHGIRTCMGKISTELQEGIPVAGEGKGILSGMNTRGTSIVICKLSFLRWMVDPQIFTYLFVKRFVCLRIFF